MESQVLQNLVFEHLRNHQKTQTVGIIRGITALAKQRGLITDPSQFTDDDQERVRELIWALILQGVLVPGMNPNLPHIKVTAYGLNVLAVGDFVPHDPDGYLGKLKSRIPNIDPIILIYVEQALATFRTGNYLPSAVMLGVASEKAMLLLVESFRIAINDATKRGKFDQNTNSRPIKRQYEELRKRIEPLIPTLTSDLREVLLLQFDGVYDFIRRYRNDSGHPTGKKLEREESFALLQLFPTYCKTTYDLMTWLAAHPIL